MGTGRWRDSTSGGGGNGAKIWPLSPMSNDTTSLLASDTSLSPVVRQRPPPFHRRAGDGEDALDDMELDLDLEGDNLSGEREGGMDSRGGLRRRHLRKVVPGGSADAGRRLGDGFDGALIDIDDSSSDNDDRSDHGDEEDVVFVPTSSGLSADDVQKFRDAYERLAAQMRDLALKVSEMKKREKEVSRQSKKSEMENRDLKQKLELLQKENSEMEEMLSLSMTRGGFTHADNRNLDAEERKKRFAARNALLEGVEQADDELVLTADTTTVGALQQLYSRLTRWFVDQIPLSSDVKSIHSHFGSSVASYFLFYRWLLGMYMALAIPTFFWLVVHVVDQVREDRFVSSTTGVVPEFMSFHSFTSEADYSYTIMILSIMAVQTAVVLRKWIKEDMLRRALNSLEMEQKHVQFAKTFLFVWDNTVQHESEVENMRYANGQTIMVMLAEIRKDATLVQRTFRVKAILFLRRSCGVMMYIALQLFAWAAIIYLTSKSEEYGNSLSPALADILGTESLGTLLASSIVPTAVSIINSVMPKLITFITEQERWDSQKTVTYMLTGRMYLAKILNAFIQAFSYMLLANPYLLSGIYPSARRSIERVWSNSYPCRIDQAASGLFQLVITEFIVFKVIEVGTVFAVKLGNWAFKKPFAKDEFGVAKMMVSLLYFQALVLASFPFFPQGVLFVTGFLFLSFKYDKFMLERYKAKPKNPWKAQDAGAFFIKFYLATLVCFGLLNTYFAVTSKEFPKSCDIQDDSPGLCATALVNDTCTMDTSNEFYSWFSKESDCELDGYPFCICDESIICGPFLAKSSMWDVCDKQIRKLRIIGSIYGACVDYAAIAWVIAIIFYYVSFFAQNSLKVSQDAASERDRMWIAEVESLQANLRKQTKTIQKLELQASLQNQET